MTLQTSEHGSCFEADLLLVDLDGTLVDSSLAVTNCWRQWCRKHSVSEERIFSISEGRQAGSVIAEIAPHLDSVAEDQELIRFQLRDLHLVREVPGAGDFLRQLSPEQWAIVTSCTQQLARARLDATNLPVPQLLAGAEAVRRGKPSPEGFLLAAQSLGVAPERCLVFEDSAAGLAAAASAGMAAIAVTGAARHPPRHNGTSVQDWTQIKLAQHRPMLLRIEG